MNWGLIALTLVMILCACTMQNSKQPTNPKQTPPEQITHLPVTPEQITPLPQTLPSPAVRENEQSLAPTQTLTVDRPETTLGDTLLACVNKTLIGNFQLTTTEENPSLALSTNEQHTPGCFNLNNLTWDLGFSSDSHDYNISFVRAIERMNFENRSVVKLDLGFFGSKDQQSQDFEETNPVTLRIRKNSQ